VLGEEKVYWFGGRMEAPPGATPAHLDLGEVRLDLAGGEHLYRHFDMRGNVKFVTDAAGTVVAHHGYGAYGREVTYGPSDDARGFAGGAQAAEFVVLGARVLDAEAGRFLSPDPVDPWLDSYAYTWGNPLHFWDPGGLEPQPVPQGPPVAATVLDIMGDVVTGAGTIITAIAPGWAKVIGGVLIAAGTALKGLATGIRDDAARRGASWGESIHNGYALVPAGDIGWFKPCSECRVYPGDPPRPLRRARPAPPPSPGARGIGFDLGGAATGCGMTYPCGLGPELVLLLPWLLGRRRRRLEDSLKVRWSEARESAGPPLPADSRRCRMVAR
jgi:RHS repeat-associated protein